MTAPSFRTLAVWRRLGILVAGLGLVVIVGPLGLTGDYASFLLTAIAFNAIVVLAVSLLAGLSGIWTLGHTAFIAIGTYLTVNMPSYGVPLEGIVVLAMVASAAIGYLLGLSAGRFSVLYFGLLTLALGLTAFEIIGHWTSVTGGDGGIAVPSVHSLLLRRMLGIKDGPAATLILATFAYEAADIVGRGLVGRRWLAVKSQRTASMAVGLVPYRENAFAFAFSAALASLAGICIAISIGYIDPETFSLNNGVMLIVGTVVGGVGSFAGAVLGAVFIVGVPELARDVRDVSIFVFGASMIVVLLFLRRGLVPSLIDAMQRLVRRLRRAAAPPANPTKTDLAAFTALLRDLMPPASLGLVASHVTVTFGGVKALHDVSIAVPPGSTVGLLGPNGAGKTTLLNTLSEFVKPHGNTTLRLGDVDLASKPPFSRISHGIGRTFQHAELFAELTIRESLHMVAAMAERRRARAGKRFRDGSVVAERIIAGLGLIGVANAYPSALPFGVQKVADIARVLAAGASFVALDEPFSGLDRIEADELRSILRGMQQAGISILIIDHAVHEIFDIADEVVVLNFGRLLAAGKPDEIQRDPRVHEAYFGTIQTLPLGEKTHA